VSLALKKRGVVQAVKHTSNKSQHFLTIVFSVPGTTVYIKIDIDILIILDKNPFGRKNHE